MSAHGEPSNRASRRRFRPRFRLRTFLVVVTIFCVWLGWHIHGARRQRDALAAIREWGGIVDYERESMIGRIDSEAWSTTTVRSWLGDDFFYAVDEVEIPDENPLSQEEDDLRLPIDQLTRFNKLRVLRIWDSRVSDDDLTGIAKLHSLAHLELRSARRVTDEGVKRLRTLKQLELIHIEDSQITDVSLNSLSWLPQLATVSLWGNSFNDEGARYLQRIENLRSLQLPGDPDNPSPLADKGLEFLLKLPTLVQLNVASTSVSKEFVAKVQMRFPDCAITGP